MSERKILPPSYRNVLPQLGELGGCLNLRTLFFGKSCDDNPIFVQYLTQICLLALLGFVLGSIILVVSPHIVPETLQLSQLIARINTLDPFAFFLSILFNNIFVGMTIMFSAIFRIRVLPRFAILVNICANTMILGSVVGTIGWMPVLAWTVPHGCIEIPMIILASTYGAIAADRFSSLPVGTSTPERIRNYIVAKVHVPRTMLISYAFRPYFTRVLPMTIIAAGIEAYISTLSLRTAMGM